MALTNYLGQSAATSLLFYGLGWYGRLGWTDLWLIAAAILAAQIVFSLAWFAAFRFGPVEWLLRSVAYWRPQPMLRCNAKDGAALRGRPAAKRRARS
jgi:uncharacterized protein